jgi:hypothetical protein
VNEEAAALSVHVQRCQSHYFSATSLIEGKLSRCAHCGIKNKVLR